MRNLSAFFLLAFPCFASTIATFKIQELYGVNHPTQVFEATVGNFNTRTSHLLAPNNVDEVAYQYNAATGKITFQAGLPASTVPRFFPDASNGTDTTLETVAFTGTTGYGYDFATDQLVYYVATGGSCGLSTGTYFVKSYNYYLNSGVVFTTTLGGSAVNLTSACSGNLTYTGFLANASTDTITAPHHGRNNGDPFSVAGSACSASGLTCDGTTQYFVINATTNTFQVSTSVGGSVFNITGDITTGLNQLITNWTWTLVDTGAPSASPTNGVVTDLSDPTRIRLTNGLGAGVDILARPTPMVWTTAASTLTNCVVSGGGSIVCTTSTAHGLLDGTKISINGVSDGFGPTGVWSITSHTTTTITIATGRTDLTNGTFNFSNYPLMALVSADMSLNPIRGIKLADGTWVAKDTHLYQGNNIAFSAGGITSGSIMNSEAFLNYLLAFGRTYTTKFLESGPVKTTVEITMTSYRPKYVDGATVPIPGSVEGIDGLITFDVTLYANSKSVQVKYSGDVNFGMFMDIYTDWPGTKPTNIGTRVARAPGCGTFGFGGAALNSGVITGATNANPIVITSPGNGINKANIWTVTISGVNGNTNANTTQFATPIDQDHFSIPVSGNGAFTSSPNAIWTATSTDFQQRYSNMTKAIGYSGPVINGSGCDSGTRPEMLVWNFDGGGGMQQWVYNSAGASSDPALGIYTGRASVMNDSTQMTMGFHSDVGALSVFGANFPCTNCQAGTRAFYSGNVREFMIYEGTIGDLAGVSVEGSVASGQNPSAMSLEQNTIAGVNLTALYSYDITFSSPVGGWKSPYVPDAVINGVSGIKANYVVDNPAGFKAALDRSAGKSGGAILAMWTSGSSAIDSGILTPALEYSNIFIYSLVWGDGVRDICCEYVQGTYFTGPLQVQLSTALADSAITAGQTVNAKAYAALFMSLIWDYNFIPQFVGGICICGDTGGTLNQDEQVAASKQRYVTAFPTHPVAIAHAAEVTSELAGNMMGAINAKGGGGAASAHYIPAELTDTAFGILANIVLGGGSPNSYPLMDLFTDFHANTLFSPDPRFNNRRTYVNYGDGEIGEPTGISGMFSSAYVGVNTSLAQRAFADWGCQNIAPPNAASPYRYAFNDFFGTTLPAVNTTTTNGGCSAIGFASKNYPGVLSALRVNPNTANEHLIMVSNGIWLSDHAHPDKTGLLSSSFWNIPWLQDVSSARTPDYAGAYFHNTVIDDADLSITHWYDSIGTCTPPQDKTCSAAPGAAYGVPSQTEMLVFSHSVHAGQNAVRLDGTTQSKLVSLLNFNTAKPILHDYSTFTGTSAGDGKSIAYFQNYNGQAVATPDGSTTATVSLAACTDPPVNYPSLTTKHTIGSGVAGPWSWTGGILPQLANGGNGMNWDAYAVRSDAGDEYLLGDTRNACTNFNSEFAAGNTTNITSWVSVDSTSQAHISLTGFQLFQGETLTTAGATCAGGGNQSGLTVASISGTTAVVTGFSGLTGPCSGGTIAPDFMLTMSMWRLHSSGASFDVSFLPYLKSGSAQSAPTCISGTCTVVNGSETTTYSPSAVTYTNGTVKSVASVDGSSQSAFSIALTGGTQEAYCATSTSCGGTITGFTAGTRTLDLSGFGGNWYPDIPTGSAGTNKFTIYHPGTDPVTGQPVVITVNLSTTPVTFRSQYIGWKDANATSIAVSVGGTSTALFACDGTTHICGGVLQMAPGTYTITNTPIGYANANTGSQVLVVP